MLAALLAAQLPSDDEGELLVRVQPWHEALEGTPVFIEGASGTRVAALDRHGVVRVSGLAPGDYRLELPRSAANMVCRWSPECGPVRVRKGEVTEAVIHVYKASSVSSSEVRIPGS